MAKKKNTNESNGAQARINLLPHAEGLRNVMIWYYLHGMLATKLPWKMTAWTGAGFPIEMLWAYDVFPLHPENMATVSAARGKTSQQFIEHAEGMGYSRDLCSYCKTNFGAVDTCAKTFKGGIAKPDFIAITNTICDTHWKWFQIQARKFKVPAFVFDCPSYVSGTDEKTMERYIDYVVDQFFEFNMFMKKNFGKTMDEEKMRRVMEKSDRLCELWMEIYELRKSVPASYSSAETSASFFPLVVLPGVDVGIKFFENIRDDLKKRIARGEGTLSSGKEKFRLMFEGIPFWYRMKFMYELAKYEAVVVYEPYTYSFGPRKPLDLNLLETLRRVARTMMDLPYSYNLEKRIDYFKKVVADYRLDGVILHENMSCRPSSTGMMDLKEAIQRDCGIPVLILQCDMNDPRAYSEGPIKTRVEGFIELMEQNRAGRS
ncbi:MAG TPA: 2-hydroxyacyl-CoA dehydratase family protein [Spirochaetota bacterium]|nr:2-hydroxyacyl-CoA dehydratase family protein [Spirochaetota bacterium]